MGHGACGGCSVAGLAWGAHLLTLCRSLRAHDAARFCPRDDEDTCDSTSILSDESNITQNLNENQVIFI